MQDIADLAGQLRRPRLLVRAARFGVDDYRRGRTLARLFASPDLPRPALAVLRLIDMEGELNAQRLDRDATYSVARHIEVLIALLGETRLVAAARRAAPVAAGVGLS